jgi:hypothetical protein
VYADHAVAKRCRPERLHAAEDLRPWPQFVQQLAAPLHQWRVGGVALRVDQPAVGPDGHVLFDRTNEVEAPASIPHIEQRQRADLCFRNLDDRPG